MNNLLIDTGLFLAEVWNNHYETKCLSLGIIPYFHKQNLNVYFIEDNPFFLLNLNYQKIAAGYLLHYPKDIKSTNYLEYRAAYAIKYLAEELKSKPVNSPICLIHKDGKYFVSKGNKKIVALALVEKFIHPIIIVSNDKLDCLEIKNDIELYTILKTIDPSANKFYTRIEDVGNGLGFHFLTKHDTTAEWVLPLRT